MFSIFIPACQVKVVRFHVSCPARLSLLLPRQTSTASSWSQWPPPELNCKLFIPVVPAGPELQALDRSGPCRTSTASSWLQQFLPDPNIILRIKVILAGPQPQRISEDISDRMPERMSENKCQKECQNRCQIECQTECQNICQKVSQNRCQTGCQNECQKICQKECQIECQNKYAIYTSRWHVRNYIRIVLRWGSLEESSLIMFPNNIVSLGSTWVNPNVGLTQTLHEEHYPPTKDWKYIINIPGDFAWKTWWIRGSNRAHEKIPRLKYLYL